MISYLNGKIVLKKENFIILEVGGVGYEIFLSRNSLTKIPQIGQPLKLFCYLDVGERSLKLYGFLDYQQLQFFKVLRSIRGVGPKSALEICSICPIEKLKEEIVKGNEKIFDNIPGIGKKTAKKIILELSGKLSITSKEKEKVDKQDQEIIGALENLGFKKEEIKKALANIPQHATDFQQKLKEALKILGK